MLSINQLYGEVDNLTSFVHPVYQRRFDFLSDERLLLSAQQIAAKIERSGYRKIVVSETGARPLAYVCERLLEQSGMEVHWTYMKFPRKPVGSIYPLIMFYLTEDEKQEKFNGKPRLNVMKEICASMPASTFLPSRKSLAQILQEIGRSNQDEWQKSIARTLEGTAIAEFLGQPFLFFDEYIDSGTTLQNANLYFNCFTENLDFKTLSYYTNIRYSSKFGRIFSTEFDQDTQLECYSRGAYPFENRIDMIGYYYFINCNSYIRRSLEEVVQIFGEQKQVEPTSLLSYLTRVIRQRNLVAAVKEQAKIPAVAQFLDESHLARYYLSALEQATNDNGPSYEFLWQLFEMYGPIWSPMPDKYHLDFLHVFEGTRNELKTIPEFERLKEKYEKSRAAILVLAAGIGLKRKNSWMTKIDCILRGHTNEN